MSENFRDEMTARMNYLERQVEDKTFELWDYYAAAALTGVMANEGCWNDGDIEEVATVADAMIAERNKRMERRAKCMEKGDE